MLRLSPRRILFWETVASSSDAYRSRLRNLRRNPPSCSIKSGCHADLELFFEFINGMISVAVHHKHYYGVRQVRAPCFVGASAIKVTPMTPRTATPTSCPREIMFRNA